MLNKDKLKYLFSHLKDKKVSKEDINTDEKGLENEEAKKDTKKTRKVTT